jgi:hypothetical protein
LPSAPGVKVTEIEQLDPPANVLGDVGQFEVCAKSPEVEIPEIVSAPDWLFFSVIVLGALVVVTTWLKDDRLIEDRAKGSMPLPTNDVVCGLFGPSSLTVRTPDLAPDAVGVKVTEIVQLDRAAKVFGETGQFEVCAKSPEVEIPEMVRGIV